MSDKNVQLKIMSIKNVLLQIYNDDFHLSLMAKNSRRVDSSHAKFIQMIQHSIHYFESKKFLNASNSF